MKDRVIIVAHEFHVMHRMPWFSDNKNYTYINFVISKDKEHKDRESLRELAKELNNEFTREVTIFVLDKNGKIVDVEFLPMKKFNKAWNDGKWSGFDEAINFVYSFLKYLDESTESEKFYIQDIIDSMEYEVAEFKVKKREEENIDDFNLKSQKPPESQDHNS